MRALARELAHLLVHVAVGVAVALVLAVLAALIHGGSFRSSFAIGSLAVGAICLLLVPAGQQASYRNIEMSGRVPNMPAWLQTQPGDTTLATGAVFALTAVALLALGAVLHG